MTRRVFLLFQLALLPVAPFAAYVIGLVLGLGADEAVKAVTLVLPPFIVLAGMVQPWLVIDRLVTQALERRPADAPGERLTRILELPQRIVVFGWLLEWVVGVCGFCFACIALFGKPLEAAPAGLLVGLSFALLIGVPLALRLEAMLLPYALEAGAAPAGQTERFSFFRPRQKWFLPYSFAVFLVATFVVNGAIDTIREHGQREALATELASAGYREAAAIVRTHDEAGLGSRAGQLAGILDLLAISSVAAWLLARRQEAATGAIRSSLEAMADGRSHALQWVSSDELGDLAARIGDIIERMRELPLRLQGSVKALASAGAELEVANEAQNGALARQMGALAQSRQTAAELRQASLHAVSRAEAAMDSAGRAEVVGRIGAEALAASLAGLDDIGRAVEELRACMARLERSTSAIGDVASTVKDLADQSNMLALNAAIEAVRSGENGRAFGVVAREMRQLADLSIQSTREIRERLSGVREAIGTAVAVANRGAARVQAGVDQVKSSSASLQQLGSMVTDGSAAMREIAAVVAQLQEGVGALFAMFEDISRGAAEVSNRLAATEDARRTLLAVSGEVDDVARRFEAA